MSAPSTLAKEYLRHTGVLDADRSVLDASQTKQCHHIHWLLGAQSPITVCVIVPTSAGPNMSSFSYFTALADHCFLAPIAWCPALPEAPSPTHLIVAINEDCYHLWRYPLG